MGIPGCQSFSVRGQRVASHGFAFAWPSQKVKLASLSFPKHEGLASLFRSSGMLLASGKAGTVRDGSLLAAAGGPGTGHGQITGEDGGT
jgi:hypothetical protein